MGSRKPSRGFHPGTMYMTDDMVQYYQAVDGQLCFLSGFNLNCLSNEFAAKDPVFEAYNGGKDDDDHTLDNKPPFPDIVKGQVIDVEQVHLTPDILKRMPCFSHLPLYANITMVEIDINGYLSNDTRERFKKDMKRRKEKRQARKEAEKKADREARLKEEERVEDLKKGIQRIDPNDPFFRAPAMSNPDTQISSNVFDLSDFNHSLHSEQDSISSPIERQTQTRNAAGSRPMSFSSAISARETFPTLDASNASAFPSLAAAAASTPRKEATGNVWGRDKKSVSQQPSTPRGKKSIKGKKVILFSTGGRRSYS